MPLVLERISRLQSVLKLANDREITTREMADVARQMANKVRKMVGKTLEEEAKSKERERKVRVVCAKVKEKAMIAQENERMCKIALILSWLIFVIVMLLCFGSIEFFGVKRLRLS